MKGKNFSCNNMGQRKEKDFYETPYSMTQQLLDTVKLREPILEPACGNGAVVKVLKENDYNNITSYDLQNGDDFNFLYELNGRYKTIITNPPFSQAEKFIDQALSLAPDVYFLLPLNYLHGKKRYDRYYAKSNITMGSLREIFIFSRYPMLGEPLREDGKYHTGMMVYAWYRFGRLCGYPSIKWIDNSDYVLKRGES